MDCIPDNAGVCCVNCGWQKPDKIKCWPRRNCKTKGPGDFLHDAILKWIGEGPTRECGCTDRINQMNAWGPQGCREHLEEIVVWLYDEAQKRKWTKLLTKLPGNDYVIRWMVKGAIKLAEKEAAIDQGTLSSGVVTRTVKQ